MNQHIIFLVIMSTLMNVGIYFYKNHTQDSQGWRWNDDWPTQASPPVIIQQPKPTAPVTPPVNSPVVTTNYADALQKAQTNNKSILLVFRRDGCGWCDKMKTETFDNPDNTLNSYILCLVDTNAPENKSLCQKLQVNGVPTFAVVNSQNKTLKMKSGYLPKEQFLSWLNSSSLSSIEGPPAYTPTKVEDDAVIYPVYVEPAYRSGSFYCPTCR